MENPRTDVVVVGAGIAGLVAAHRLAAAGFTPLVVEASSLPGGRIHTQAVPYGYLENGGIFHTEQYYALRGLLKELALDGQVTTVPTGFHSRVLTPRGWKHVDYGSPLGPATFGGLSVADRVRLGLAALPALRRRPRSHEDFGDLASMLALDTRTSADGLPSAAAEYFTAGPHEFLWGARSEEISFAMLALQLHVFAGELREIAGGVGQVIESLALPLDIRYGCSVRLVEETPDGPLVHIADESTVQADAVVIATTADVSRTIWPTAPAAVTRHLDGIDYSRIDYVYLHTKRPLTLTQGRHSLSMEVIPTASRGVRTIGGIYQANGWASEGGLLLVTAAIAAGAEAIADDELVERLHREAEELHPELSDQVQQRVLIRHERYTPTFGLGSIRRLVDARAALATTQVDLAGDHMSAPWVDGAIRSGEMAARRITDRLRATRATRRV